MTDLNISLSSKSAFDRPGKLESLFEKYDRNGDGSIDYEEFQNIMQETFRA